MVSRAIAPDALLTSHQVAALLQMDPSSIVKWVNAGRLAAYRTPGGHRRVRASDLLAFLKSKGMFVPFTLEERGLKVLAVGALKKAASAWLRQARAEGDEVNITVCPDALEALLVVSELKPHVVVVDLGFAQVDAPSFRRALKQHTPTAKIPVLTHHVTWSQIRTRCESVWHL